MNISSSIIDNEFPLKYFYCAIEGKEFILTGDINGMIYCTEISNEIGNILIELINYANNFSELLHKYANEILNTTCHKEEQLNQNIVEELLFKLQKILKEQCTYFNYADILMDISHRYMDLCNEYTIENQKYSDYIDWLKQLKEVTPSCEENEKTLSRLDNVAQGQLEKIETMKSTQFKDFVVEQLNHYIDEINILMVNTNLYCKLNNNKGLTVTDKERISGANSLIAYNYNFISEFNQFCSIIKGVIYKNGKIFTDEDINYKEELENIRFIQMYKFNNIIELLNLSFINVVNYNIPINMCSNCKKLFIPKSRTDEVYCDNISPQNAKKTCKEYGAKKTYREAIKSDLVKNEHNKTSQYFRMKIKRAKTSKEKTLYEKQFNKYKENYQKKKEQYDLKKIDEDIFVEWIEKQKNIK